MKAEAWVWDLLVITTPCDVSNNNNNNFITLRSHECGINEEYTDI